jgi:hypothetical protein
MKKMSFITILIFSSTFIFSQRKTEIIKSKELNFIFNNMYQHYRFETNNNSFNFFLVKQRSNKFYFDETDETLNDLYLGVSEFGEYPEQQLFRISNIISIDTNSIKFKEGVKKYIEFNYKIIENGRDIKVLNTKINYK